MLNHRGFTLIEVLVGIAIFAALTGIIALVLFPRLRQSAAGRTVADFRALHEAVSAFRGDVGQYPRALAQLAAPIAAGDANLCGTAYGSGRVPRWRGPYVDRLIEDGGVPTGFGVFGDTLGRFPPTAATPSAFGALLYGVAPVDRTDALEVELLMDDTVDVAAGTVRWTAGLLLFIVPITGC